MARYTDDSRERVRAAVDFVDLVGSRVELRKAGVRRYTGLCPFHDERSPSFGIDPVEKLYHCFGCGEGGDVFKWVMEIESVPFGEALELLADRYNVTLDRTEEDPRAAQTRQRRDRLHALLERTAAYYVRLLWESEEAAPAREYLRSRGLEEPALREFRVGYSPSGWDRVVAGSQRAGYSADELLAAGLAQRSRGGSGLIDRFRGRLMFPWADARGRVLGFGARALAEGQQPMYLNSSDGEVFHKGRQVYGVDLARRDAAKAGTIVLVEGYTDVIALHQAGVRNVVGQQGTALTPDQANLLSTLAQTVLLCLDADAAGQSAMLKAAATVRGLKSPPDLRVVPLPPGTDPADAIARDGADAVRALLDRALPFPRWQVEHALASGDTGTPDGRERLLGEVAPVVNALPQGILRQELVRVVADRLALSEALMESALGAAKASGARPSHAGDARRPGSRPPYDRRGGGPPTRRDGGRRDGHPAPRDEARPRRPGPGPDGFAPAHPADDPSAVPPPVEEDDSALAALLAADPGREGDGASAAPAAPPRPVATNPALRALERRSETEHAFLALCVAYPAAGARRLQQMDIDTLFSEALARRAAQHLREHADAPAAGVDPDDHALTGFLAELVARAGSLTDPEPAELDRAALMLDLARLDRDIAAARHSQDPLSDLAAERQRVLGQIRKMTR